MINFIDVSYLRKSRSVTRKGAAWGEIVGVVSPNRPKTFNGTGHLAKEITPREPLRILESIEASVVIVLESSSCTFWNVRH